MKVEPENLQSQVTRAAAAYTKQQAAGSAMSAAGSFIAGTVGKNGISLDLSSKTAGITAYGREKEMTPDLLQQAGQTDVSARNRELLVCASTMSPEDYKKMVEEGVKPEKTEPSDTVTILDHIKAAVAKGGTVVAGFNGEGDMDLDKLTELTGSPVYAKQLADAFSEKDLPLSEETAEDTIKEIERAGELTELTDGMKQYMIENRIEPTIDGLYLAKYSAGEKRSGGGSYFAEDLAGYIGKTGGEADLAAMDAQIEKVIEEAELSVGEKTKEQCRFLLDADLLLTPDNLRRLSALEDISLPPEREEVISAITKAYEDGLSAKDADLSGNSLSARAEALIETVEGITDQAVEKVIESGQSFTIRSLSVAQRELSLSVSAYISTSAGESTAALSFDTKQGQQIEEARQIVSGIRLQMTPYAARTLLSQRYPVNTTPLAGVLERLGQINGAVQKTWGLSIHDEAQNSLFVRTMTIRADLYEMPAAILGGIRDSAEKLDLLKVHDLGASAKQQYQKAGESYEALMTAPRADLGDRITKAFSNVDVLLDEQDMPATEDNRRAVRILGYNSMEITKENIESVKAADATVRGLLEQMHPAATLQMIRDGINPLEKSIGELSDYFKEQELSSDNQNEKFSRFLYELDRAGGISKEERETYMGIYRLLHQIEKDDGKVIGTVVNNGQKLTFANLLSASRTFKTGGISQSVDDQFGGVESRMQKSISSQIETYYTKKAGQLTDTVTPELLKSIGVDFGTLFDELIDAQVVEETKTAEEYRAESYGQYKEALKAPEQAAQFLAENGITVSAENLMAAKQITKDAGYAFRNIRDLARKLDGGRAGSEDEIRDAEKGILSSVDLLLGEPLSHFTDAENAGSAFEAFSDSVSELLTEQIHQADASYLDVKGLQLCGKVLSVISKMSRQETYELPALIDGELVAVNVRFAKAAAAKEAGAAADLHIELSSSRRISARFTLSGDALRGTVGVSDNDLSERISDKLSGFDEKLLAETGKKADINVIYSKSLLAAPGSAGERSGGDAKVLYLASKLFIEALAEL